jgi:hypothetical protein
MTTIFTGSEQVRAIVEAIVDEIVQDIELGGEYLNDAEDRIRQLQAVAGDDGAVNIDDVAVIVDPAGFIHLTTKNSL